MSEKNTELMDRIKGHFSDLERTHLYVEEWDQDIYMAPISMRDRQTMQQRSKDSPMQIAIYGLILSAENEKGDKLFGLDDKVTLMNNMTYETVEKIMTAMLLKTDPEQAEKN